LSHDHDYRLRFHFIIPEDLNKGPNAIPGFSEQRHYLLFGHLLPITGLTTRLVVEELLELLEQHLLEADALLVDDGREIVIGVLLQRAQVLFNLRVCDAEVEEEFFVFGVRRLK
jgi:hypothetical protein